MDSHDFTPSTRSSTSESVSEAPSLSKKKRGDINKMSKPNLYINIVSRRNTGFYGGDTMYGCMGKISSNLEKAFVLVSQT